MNKADSAAAPWLLDAHGMHQCLMNLVRNALDATAASGDGWVRASTRVTDEDELELRIQDSGDGIDATIGDDLFSSMVSTKGSKGTGLGLLVVHKIVSEHAGKVTLDSRSAPGATFRIVLPKGPRPDAATVTETPNDGDQASDSRL